METFSPEMTWISRSKPAGLRKREGMALVKSINHSLPDGAAPVYAKLDANVYGSPFHHIETNPLLCYFQLDWLKDENWPVFRRMLQKVFNVMKDHGLAPAIVDRKGNEEIHYPGGGCHLHMEADLFGAAFPTHWFKLMSVFTRNLDVDFANRPYLRWLFSHWFADEGTSVMATPEDFDSFGRAAKGDDYYWIPTHRPIECRLIPCRKNIYCTYELRFFSMVECPEELKLIARFAEAWMKHVRKQTFSGWNGIGKTLDPIPFTLTRAKWLDMQNRFKARDMCKECFDELGLYWGDYRVFFDRNYIRRIKWGEWV